MPAIVSWPGHLPEGQVRGQMAHGCDWLPTIAELCGVPLPKVHLDGKSLAAVIRSADAPTPHDVLHWQLGESWAVRSGDWKLLHDPVDTTRRAPGERIPGDFLVNLRDDPSEATERRRPAPGRRQSADAATRFLGPRSLRPCSISEATHWGKGSNRHGPGGPGGVEFVPGMGPLLDSWLQPGRSGLFHRTGAIHQPPDRSSR